MYKILILPAAVRDLEKLDRFIGNRIVRRVSWLAEKLDRIGLEALKGDLSGLYRFRVGDYRVIYEILHGERTIVIHYVGHRREVYRRR